MEKDVLYLIFAWANNILHRKIRNAIPNDTLLNAKKTETI